MSSNPDFTALYKETLANLIKDGVYNQSSDLNRLQWGATYSDTSPSALSINITLTTCLAKAPGYQRSNKLSEWATPLFGFLLPAVAFVLTVGRPKRLAKFEYLIFKRLKGGKGRGLLGHAKRFAWASLMLIAGLLLTTFSVILDTTLWGISVFVFAGPLMAGSVYKAINDFLILRHLQQKRDHSASVSALDRYLMAVVLVGTFD
jgi:hypothetical protein